SSQRTHLLSDLFPYTTLFRSVLLGYRVDSSRFAIDLQAICHQAGRFATLPDSHHPMEEGSRCRASAYLPERRPLPADPTATAVRDRKSTRLNSSHVKISYAVF